MCNICFPEANEGPRNGQTTHIFQNYGKTPWNVVHTADYFTVGCLLAYKSMSLFTKEKKQKTRAFSLKMLTVLYNLHTIIVLVLFIPCETGCTIDYIYVWADWYCHAKITYIKQSSEMLYKQLNEPTSFQLYNMHHCRGQTQTQIRLFYTHQKVIFVS